MEVAARKTLLLVERCWDLLAHCTGQDLDTVKGDAERDHYLTPEEAKVYELMDQVLADRTDAEPGSL